VEFQGQDGWLQGPEIAEVRELEGGVLIVLREGADPQSILRRGVASEARIDRFELVEPSLHEIFVRHAGGEEKGHPSAEPWERRGEGVT
jgi:ABC-2 type transport system ATP-binding protein